MTWIIKILLFLMVLTLLRMLLGKLIAPLLRSPRPRPGRPAGGAVRTISGQTVKDPQCGMYIATDIAVSARRKGKTFYFCSEKCRDEYLRANEQRGE